MDGRNLYGGGAGVEGSGYRPAARVRRSAAFQAVIDAIVEATVTYLSGQIENGVDAVQLFDSWAGSLSPAQYEQWVIAPNAEIVRRLRALHPDTPIIGFQRVRAASSAPMPTRPGSTRSGSTKAVDPLWADAILPAHLTVQGNLDPLALVAGGEALDTAIDRILAAFPSRPHIFNLGHGIVPDTPIAHVEHLIRRVRGG